MTIHLTEAQTAVLRAQKGAPVEIETSDGERFVVIERDAFAYLSDRSKLEEAATKERLREMIQEGIDSGEGVPADEVYRECLSDN